MKYNLLLRAGHLKRILTRLAITDSQNMQKKSDSHVQDSPYIYTAAIKGTMNQITNLLFVLIVTLLFVLPTSAIMYASGSPQNSDDGGGGGGGDSSSDNSDESDDGGSMDNNDDAMDSGSMDDESDTMSMDDESDTMSMDDESDTWSMEKSNNALNPSSSVVTTVTTSPLSPPSTGGPTVTTSPLSPPSTEQPTVTTSPLSPPSTEQPTVTNNTLNPPSSGLRIESNSTGNAEQQSNSTADFINTILTAMNRERDSLFGFYGISAPMGWNPELAKSAKTWAEHLATLPVIGQSNGHSTADGAGNFYGETVAVGPTDYPTDRLVAAWIAEKKDYHGEVMTNENYLDFGHYTQIVWKTTDSVGCATASGSGHNILVCQYFPPGNVFGKTPAEGGLPSWLHLVE